jgi:2-(1,2-epoxy-1,2-dihydrophenyl)acetyl-CoA isomerase
VPFSTIIYEVRDRVGIITLNRPEKLNAWTLQMSQEIGEALVQGNDDKGVGCMLFRGAGPRAFCAGADIIEQFKRRADAQDAGQLEQLEGAQRPSGNMPSLIELLHFGKPSVAALHGYAMGIGVTLPMHCDMRIAAESLKLNTQFLNVGLTPEFGSTYLLPRMIGLAKTLELVLLPKTYSAQEALEMGLVNRVVPDDRLMDEAMEIATTIAKRPTFAVKKAKETIYQNFDRHWLEALQVEMAVFAECMSTAEHREGIRAFMEKRPPDFTRLD